MPQLSLHLQLTSIRSIAIVDYLRKRGGCALPYPDILSSLKDKLEYYGDVCSSDLGRMRSLGDELLLIGLCMPSPSLLKPVSGLSPFRFLMDGKEFL